MGYIVASPGTNLEGVQDAVASLIQDGGGITWTYNDPANTLTPAVDHGGIGGLSDDDHVQYHNDTRGDIRYYQKSEFLNSSAGAGDAGKPVKLDAGGLIDASMIDDSDIDHGSIGGLADDDHAQYFKVTGRSNEDLTMTGTGDILWATDGGASIGTSGANRPAKVFVKNQVEINPSTDTTDFSLMARTRTNSQYGIWFEHAFSPAGDSPHVPLLHLNRLTSTANNGVGISFAVDAGDYSKEHAIVSGIRAAAGGADGELAIGVRISDVTRQEVARFSKTGLALTKSSTANLIWSTDAAGNIGSSSTANRPGSVFVKDNITVGASVSITSPAITVGQVTMNGAQSVFSGDVVSNASTDSIVNYWQISGNGNSSRATYGYRMDLSGTSTSSGSASIGGAFFNNANYGGNNANNGSANFGMRASSANSGTGNTNVGAWVQSDGGLRSQALLALADSNAGTSGYNMAVSGFAATTGTTPIVSAGYFKLHSSPSINDVHTVSAALIADNGDSSLDIFRAEDGGSLCVRVKDGGDLEVGKALVTLSAAVALTADNQAVVTLNRSFITLTSDDATATNRTFTLDAGVAGQRLTLMWNDATNAGELVDTGNAKLSATWTNSGSQYNTLSLICDGTNWIELCRSANA